MNRKIAVRFLDRTSPPHIVTLVLLASASALSMTMFLPSLPNMTAYFQSEYRVMQLSVATYLFMNGLLHIVLGPLSDRYGRRPVMIWAIVLFILATIGCLLSPSVEMFLAFRMMQAVIVAGMVLSRAAVRDMVPQDEAASMIGYVTMGMAMVPMVAPTLGGLLDESFGWQASFGFLLLFGFVLLAITFHDLGETAIHRSASFAQQFRDYPELFRSRRFWGYAAVATCASGGFFAFLGGVPIIGTDHFGLSPSQLGMCFGLTALGYMLGNFISGRWSRRFGVNRMVLYGSAVMLCCPVVGFLALALDISHPLGFFSATSIIGISNGMILPNATAGMLSVRLHLAGTASGIGGALTIGGGAGVSALAGTIVAADPHPAPMLAIFLACTVTCLLATLYITMVEHSLRRREAA